MLKSIPYLLFFYVFNLCLCQENINNLNDSQKVKVLPLPTIGFEPETNVNFGAVSLFSIDFYQDTLTRVSNAKIEFNYSLRNQIILESDWNYFFKEEKWFSDGTIHFSKYPDYYFGKGSNVSEEDKILFESNRLIISLGFYNQIKKKLFIGGGVKYNNYMDLTSPEINPYQELKTSWSTGLISSLFYDSRNNLLNSSNGALYKINFDFCSGTQKYIKSAIDLRRYFTVKYNFVIACKVFNSFIIGTPNFYDYSILGGDEHVRGYFYGKLRDHHLSTVQTEIRTPQIWRIGLAIISGISSIYNSSGFAEDLKPNFGIGIRILADKNDDVNLRFDYVIGNDNNMGFYINFGESF